MAGRGAFARASSSPKIDCSISVAPRPPYSFGHETPAQPAAWSLRCHSRSNSYCTWSPPRGPGPGGCRRSRRGARLGTPARIGQREVHRAANPSASASSLGRERHGSRAIRGDDRGRAMPARGRRRPRGRDARPHASRDAGSAHDLWPDHVEAAAARGLRLAGYSRPGPGGRTATRALGRALCGRRRRGRRRARGRSLSHRRRSGGGPHTLPAPPSSPTGCSPAPRSRESRRSTPTGSTGSMGWERRTTRSSRRRTRAPASSRRS